MEGEFGESDNIAKAMHYMTDHCHVHIDFPQLSIAFLVFMGTLGKPHTQLLLQSG